MKHPLIEKRAVVTSTLSGIIILLGSYIKFLTLTEKIGVTDTFLNKRGVE